MLQPLKASDNDDDGACHVFACAVCCLFLAWLAIFIAILVFLAVNNTHEIHSNCVGLLDFVTVSLCTPLLFPAVFYLCVAPRGSWTTFSWVACILFLSVSVYMIMVFSAKPSCLESLGDPPLLLYMLYFKAALYAVGAMTAGLKMYHGEAAAAR
jgi:hypothetical protein